MAEFLEPYEKVCPECHGAGYLDLKGKPWEGAVHLPPSYTDPFMICWHTGCQGGVVLTEEGKDFLAFLKRHSQVLKEY